ncbi:hypothetical protein [Antrihabitans stalactiti]|nr:hypothetical protein [Antrihabitans stalactiti]
MRIEDSQQPSSAVKTLALGPREMVMTDRDLTDLLKLQRVLNDSLAEQEALNGGLIPKLAAAREDLNRFTSRVSGAYVTVLLERNGGPGVALHPIVEFAVGHLLDSPPDSDDPHEREQRLYRRWLAGRLLDVDDEMETSFRKRWEESQRDDSTATR